MRHTNNNIKSNRNRRFHLMCLPMKSRSAFSTICYFFLSLPLSRVGVVHGKKYWMRVKRERDSTEWLLTDNIQHRYLMLLLITHFSWENYSDEKCDLRDARWGEMMKADSSRCKKRNPPMDGGKTAIDDDYNLWLWCLFTTLARTEKNESRIEELLENKSGADKKYEFTNEANKSTICYGMEWDAIRVDDVREAM